MQELETIINRNEYFKDFLNYQNNMLLNTFNLIFEIFEKIKECNYKKDDIVKTEKGIKATVKLLKKIHKNTIEKQLNGLECKKGCEEDIKSTEERITKLKQSLDIPISDLVEENKT
jgi:conjugal transfer/entry exclusion protein